MGNPCCRTAGTLVKPWIPTWRPLQLTADREARERQAAALGLAAAAAAAGGGADAEEAGGGAGAGAAAIALSAVQVSALGTSDYAGAVWRLSYSPLLMYCASFSYFGFCQHTRCSR